MDIDNMPCKGYKVNFTRKGRRLQTNTTFRKKSRADSYKRKLNRNLKNANARTVRNKTPSGKQDSRWKRPITKVDYLP